MPQRLQLSRQKGFRLPLGARSVARPGQWGNPFRVERTDCWLGGMCWSVRTPGNDPDRLHLDSKQRATEIAVELYRGWLRVNPQLVTVVRLQLRGLDLACWCPLTQKCHADVLIEVANAE